MIPDPGTYLLLVVLGGLVAIDGTGCGQFMVSRPFVAATLGGLVVGEPATGAAIGLVLEAFHLTVLPVGAASYPEGGAAAIAVGAVYGLGGGGAAELITATVFFLLWSRLSGESVRLMRRVNMRMVSRDPAAAADPRPLQRRHVAALALDFGRGMFLVAVGTAVLILMCALARESWGVGERVPRLLVDAAVAGLLASALRLLGGRPAAFAAGAAGGAVLLLLGR